MRSHTPRSISLGIAVAIVLTLGMAGAAAAGTHPAKGPSQHRSSLASQTFLHQVNAVEFPAPLVNPASDDIGWVDSTSSTYYLADKTNSSVDAINAKTNSFEAAIGKGLFAGSGTAASGAQKAACGGPAVGGPNGVLTLRVGGVTQLWAADGVTVAAPTSSLKVFTLSGTASGTLAANISTGGSCRADELSYDPRDQLVIIANDSDSPPFLSFISVNANPALDAVVTKLTMPNAIDGLEQSVYDPETRLFYQNVPQVPAADGVWTGEVLAINPQTKAITKTFTVTGCSPAGFAFNEQRQQELVGCSADATKGDVVNGVTYPASRAVSLIMDLHTGKIVATFHQVGANDEVWYDASNSTYYLAAYAMTSNGTSTGYATPVLGVISSLDNRWVENVPTLAGAHSVAADAANGEVFVPISNYGIAVFRVQR